jgi:hypothetical protein
MATIRFTMSEGGMFFDLVHTHSVVFPDGTRWDEVNGITDVCGMPFRKHKDEVLEITQTSANIKDPNRIRGVLPHLQKPTNSLIIDDVDDEADL